MPALRLETFLIQTLGQIEAFFSDSISNTWHIFDTIVCFIFLSFEWFLFRKGAPGS